MAGQVYRYNAANTSATKFPQSLDGQFFASEFGRGWIKPIQITSNGGPGEISTFPWVGKQVMDSAFGPDGSLYVLDYGTGYFNGDANSALYRFDYVAGGNRAPIANATGTPTSGQAPLTVAFSSAGSSDPDGDAITYAWAFGDGGTSTAANPSHTYATNNTYTATLTVRDSKGATGSANVMVGVGNTAPTVTINNPGNGQLFSYGDVVPFQISASDPEDGTVDCARAKMTYVLGHDSHGHQITSQNGCSGAISVPVDGEHDEAANIFAVFDAEYADSAGLITHKQVILQPRHRQAEHFKTSSGVALITKPLAEGGRTVGDINNGDWISFDPYKLNNVRSARRPSQVRGRLLRRQGRDRSARGEGEGARSQLRQARRPGGDHRQWPDLTSTLDVVAYAGERHGGASRPTSWTSGAGLRRRSWRRTRRDPRRCRGEVRLRERLRRHHGARRGGERHRHGARYSRRTRRPSRWSSPLRQPCAQGRSILEAAGHPLVTLAATMDDGADRAAELASK